MFKQINYLCCRTKELRRKRLHRVCRREIALSSTGKTEPWSNEGGGARAISLQRAVDIWDRGGVS